MLHVLDAAAVRRWCEDGRAALAESRGSIDDLNVYPVPDRDTGTNLLLTFESVLTAVRIAGDDLPAVAAALSRAALTGARGNSGILLSQLLRGFGEVLSGGPADGAGVAAALRRGVDLAYAGVAAPVEGTMLSVARAAADGAAGAGPTLDEVAGSACTSAWTALRLTRHQLPALREAGVVDAGGRGWVVLLEALVGVVQGRPRVAGPAVPEPAGRRPTYGGPAYEVQYLLTDTTEDAVATLRGTLAALGDSLAVVGGDGLFNVHVHVDDIGAAVEAGIAAGRPFSIAVTRFADAAPGRAVVAVCSGEGLVRLLRDAGAVVVEGQPTAGELLAAIRGTGSSEVVLLGPVVDVEVDVVEAARGQGFEVHVVRTRSAVQVLAALAVADPTLTVADDVAAMQQAASATRTGRVALAVQGATTSAGICLPGDALGIVDDVVTVVGCDIGEVAGRLVRQLCAAAELVTVVLGRGAPTGLAERLREQVGGECAGVELVVVDGGQPSPPVLLGAE